MTKQQVQQRVLQNGKPLDLDKFEWDEKTNTFSSAEDNLVLDFQGIDDCTFDTYSNCTFKTGSNCTFKTGYNCTFNTGYNCTFNTGYNCTFNTGEKCVAVRRDVYEVIEIPEGKTIRLNECREKGYTIIEPEPSKKIKIRLAEGQIVEGEIVE